jgi:hypothetical protein
MLDSDAGMITEDKLGHGVATHATSDEQATQNAFRQTRRECLIQLHQEDKHSCLFFWLGSFYAWCHLSVCTNQTCCERLLPLLIVFGIHSAAAPSVTMLEAVVGPVFDAFCRSSGPFTLVSCLNLGNNWIAYDDDGVPL